MKTLSKLMMTMIFMGFSVMLLSQTVESVSKTYNFFIDPVVESPTEFIQKYVSDSISIWQKRGRFEPTANYQQRITEENRQIQAKRLSKKAEDAYLKKYYSDKSEFKLVDYDPDNQSFLFSNEKFGNLIVPVPLNEAAAFETSWKLDQENIELFIDGEVVRVKKVPFISQGKTFLYDNTQEAVFAATKINVQLPPLELDLSSDMDYNQPDIISKNITVGSSDVDINIPETDFVNNKCFVVIIANEKYRREASVPFAVNDGKTFREYCKKTLGVPSQQIHFVENATLNDLNFEIKWITNVMQTQKGAADVIFYYAGHGVPDDATKKAYLLPVDGYGSDFATGYSLDELYTQLGSVPAKSVTYFIDACFSGSKREEGMLASARAVSVKVKGGTLHGNAVAFSASTDDQTAYPYHEKGHGLFTYFLLKKLQETSGNATYQELSDYIQENVSQKSVISNAKLQTPSVRANTILKDEWKGWKLK